MKPTLQFWLGLSLAALASTGTIAQPLDPGARRVAVEVQRPATPMSRIKSLVQQALDFSPQVREAAANWRAAQSDVEQSEGGLWPRLELGANSSALNGQSQGTSAPSGGISATLSYNLHDFGRVRSQIAARQFQSTSLRDKFRLAREDAAYETVNAYLQLVKYQRMSDIHNQYIADMQSLVEKLTEIVAVFPGRRSELTQAQTRLGQARDALAAMRSKISEAQLTLLRLTGVPAPQVGNDTLPNLLPNGGSILAAQARNNHPAVLAARAEAASARAQVQEINASLKPQTDLQMVKQTGSDANGFNTPARLFLTAKWVAFDGNSSKASAQALEERARAAEERSEQIIQEVVFNINTAASEYDIQSARRRDLTQLVKNTDQVRKDFYDQWRELGRRSLLDVLTAENEHLNTQISLVGTEVDQLLSVVRMRHEAGAFAEWIGTQMDLTPVAVKTPIKPLAVTQQDAPKETPKPIVLSTIPVQAPVPAAAPTSLAVVISTPAVIVAPASEKSRVVEADNSIERLSKFAPRYSMEFARQSTVKVDPTVGTSVPVPAPAAPLMAPNPWAAAMPSAAGEFMSVPEARF